ncbi:PFS domain-containing protein, partial [Colletotrichum tofieldiae]
LSLLENHRSTGVVEITQRVRIDVDWSLRLFVEQQRYLGHQELGSALTLTGSATCAQLLPCMEYLRQCWPLFGEQVFEGLLLALTRAGTEIEKTFFDQTRLSITVLDETTSLDCLGNPESILEVIEVLAWLSSSLREATPTDRITYITPEILPLQLARQNPKSPTSHLDARARITFVEEDTPSTKGPIEGLCWRNLLGNPVIARGFPTLIREKSLKGLEISLSAMSSLIGTTNLTLFHEQVLLKGFNAAVVPSARSDNIILWHLIVNEDKRRLPYNDDRILKLKMPHSSVSLWNLQDSRHILGWVPQASCNIGAKSANYDNLWTSPDFVRPGCVLEKCIIQGGPDMFTFGVEIALGKKDPSPNILRGTESYFERIDGLLDNYFVLYDVQDHRAWLSNGSSTLLHLVRASLRENATGDSASNYVFKESELQESSSSSSTKAALDVLYSETNLLLPIVRRVFERSDSTGARVEAQTQFSDRVMQICMIMEQLIDHQATAAKSGIPLNLWPRSQLEGLRFMDVAMRRRGAKARMVTLNNFRLSGNYWVDFTRAIGAVTLFGQQFGDLITPAAGMTGLCPEWQTVPKGKDLLAVTVYDLERILKQSGAQNPSILKLAPGIVWHKPAELFEDCICKDDLSKQQLLGANFTKNCDRFQALVSSDSLKRITHPGALAKEGAVIFGRNSKFPWKMPDAGSIEPDADDDEVKSTGTEKTPGNRSLRSLFSTTLSQTDSSITVPNTPQTRSTTPNEDDQHDALSQGSEQQRPSRGKMSRMLLRPGWTRRNNRESL